MNKSGKRLRPCLRCANPPGACFTKSGIGISKRNGKGLQGKPASKRAREREQDIPPVQPHRHRRRCRRRRRDPNETKIKNAIGGNIIIIAQQNVLSHQPPSCPESSSSSNDGVARRAQPALTAYKLPSLQRVSRITPAVVSSLPAASRAVLFIIIVLLKLSPYGHHQQRQNPPPLPPSSSPSSSSSSSSLTFRLPRAMAVL